MQPQETNVIDQPQETQQQNAQEKIPQEAQKVETEQEINWRKFREQRELERKQKEEWEKKARQKEEEAAALKAAMDALLNKPQPQTNYQSDPYEEESEDVKIQKKVEQALQEREKKLEEERRRREMAEFPRKLAETYSDFNDVCTVENLDYLEFHYPEIAKPFKYMPDGFDKWAAVYKAVKRFIPNTDSKKDQRRAEKNFNKPQSMSVSGATQTGDHAPVIMDEKRRMENWKRMQRVMKGGS